MCPCSLPSQIFHTNSVQEDPAQWKDALSKLVIYGILSPWDAELSDLLNRIAKEKKLEQLPAIKSVQHTAEDDVPESVHCVRFV